MAICHWQTKVQWINDTQFTPIRTQESTSFGRRMSSSLNFGSSRSKTICDQTLTIDNHHFAAIIPVYLVETTIQGANSVPYDINTPPEGSPSNNLTHF